MFIGRAEATRRIKAALKRKTGKTWSVSGGRGTGWGWITVQAPKSRRVSHERNPAYDTHWTTPDEPPYFEYVDADRGNWYTSDADCRELNAAFGLDGKAHCQGVSISPDERERYVEMVEADHGGTEEAIEETPAPAAAWDCPDVDPDEKVSIAEVADPVFVTAKFAVLNKNETLAEYRREVEAGECRMRKCKITHYVDLTDEQWDAFTVTLMDGRGWLAGKGGTSSSADLREVQHVWDYTEEKLELWKRHSYDLVVQVRAPKRETFYVDPQGYGYARYVGLDGRVVM